MTYPLPPEFETADRGLSGGALSEGALSQLQAMHQRLLQAAERADQGRGTSRRLRQGWRRARRNGRRIYRYPGAFWRGYTTEQRQAVAIADRRTLEKLVDSRRYDEAVALAAALLPRKVGDGKFMTLARRAFAKAGAVSWQLEAVQRLRERSDTPALAAQERMLSGRLRELGPNWLPEVQGQGRVQPSSPGRVMHLLKVSMPYRQSGYTMRSQYVLAGQREAGLDPVAVTALGFPPLEEQAPATEVVDGTTFHRLPAPDGELLKGPPDEYLTSYAQAAATLVPEIAPTVIHAHSGNRGYETAVVALALGRTFDIPVVYEVRGFFESLWSADTEWNERGELYARRHARETWCMEQAAAVVTLSESMKADIVARGIPAEKVAVVPNGVDTEQFHPKERSAELAGRWGVGDSFVFGYVSNLDHSREGHELLIDAAVQLRARGLPAVAMIIGDGRRREELEQYAATRAAGEAVIFTGRVAHGEVLDYYRLLDVFVVPRIDERAARLVTPLKPFEAMAAQVPVVVSALPALQEITGGEARGRSFRTGDAHSLMEVLAELHADPAAREQLARRGREWVVAERQWKANGRRYAELYDRVRDSGGPTA